MTSSGSNRTPNGFSMDVIPDGGDHGAGVKFLSVSSDLSAREDNGGGGGGGDERCAMLTG